MYSHKIYIEFTSICWGFWVTNALFTYLGQQTLKQEVQGLDKTKQNNNFYIYFQF